jgi:hypothetical protein
MDVEAALDFLRKYESELDGILSRFSRTRDGIHIAHDDSPRFEQMVVEIRDFYDDVLGANSYSSMTVSAFNEGVSNFTGSPSFNSVQRVKGIASSVITRLERNPELLNESNTRSALATVTQEPLKVPENVTLNWLFNHVPYSYWAAFIVLLFGAFALGVTATAKLTIVQEWAGIIVESAKGEASK